MGSLEDVGLDVGGKVKIFPNVGLSVGSKVGSIVGSIYVYF